MVYTWLGNVQAEDNLRNKLYRITYYFHKLKQNSGLNIRDKLAKTQK